MVTRKVSLKVPNAIQVGSVDVEFEVREGNTLIGTLSVSQGGVDWRAAGKRRTQSATWDRFAAMLTTATGTNSKPAPTKSAPAKATTLAPRRRTPASTAEPSARPPRAAARRGQPLAASGAAETSPPSGRAIRAWATDQGLTVNARGALSKEVREAYSAAHL